MGVSLRRRRARRQRCGGEAWRAPSRREGAPLTTVHGRVSVAMNLLLWVIIGGILGGK
jgi:hypothetical protein